MAVLGRIAAVRGVCEVVSSAFVTSLGSNNVGTFCPPSLLLMEVGLSGGGGRYKGSEGSRKELHWRIVSRIGAFGTGTGRSKVIKDQWKGV